MNYSTSLFIVLLPLFVAFYWWIRPHLGRLLVLAVSSLLFYAYAGLHGIPVLAAVIVTAYLGGLAMARWDRAAEVIAGATVAALVGDLAFFRYAGFINEQIPTGLPRLPELLVPLGISFYTFEAIAYVVDVKRGMIDAERSPLKLALFIAFFPHLIAGPIMRADDLIPQLSVRARWDMARVTNGLQLFVEGLAKKRLIADPMGTVADAVFAAPTTVSTEGAWIGVLAYTVQIYADFSGYTDMARGIARMLGLELPTNFNAPYAAHSVTDFWQRWHITLSSWLRDYVWIPLGGLRHRGIGRYVTVFVVMLIGGIWHGAGWTFAVWGAYQGAWLAFDRRFEWWQRIPRPVAIAVTLLIIVNGWVLFRSPTFDEVRTMYEAMYAARSGWTPSAVDVAYTFVAFTGVVGAMAVHRARPLLSGLLRGPSALKGVLYGAAVIAALVIAPTPTPFIYFRF